MQESCSLPASLDLCTLGPWKYQSCPPSGAQQTLHRAAANSPPLPEGEVAGRGAIFFLNYFLQYLRSSRSFFWITSLSSLIMSNAFTLSSELPMPSSPSRWRVVVNSRCNSSGGKKGSSTTVSRRPKQWTHELGGQLDFSPFAGMLSCDARIVKGLKEERAVKEDIRARAPPLCPSARDHRGLRRLVRCVCHPGSYGNIPEMAYWCPLYRNECIRQRRSGREVT